MPTLDDERAAAGLTGPLPPLPTDEEDDATKCQHGCATMPCRHTRTEEKHKQHAAADLRGVPILGRGVGGAVNGTRPGDTVRALMAEIDELYGQAVEMNAHRSRMREARKRLGK